VITFSSSISTCEKGQQWLAALELLRQMRQRRLEPKVITYNSSISSTVAGGVGTPLADAAEEARAECDHLQLCGRGGSS
jgi:pentatricopeptide repeat protein